MNFRLFSLSASLLLPIMGNAQTSFVFANKKTFKQIGPESFEFEGGALDLRLADGSFFLVPCSWQPSVSIVQPTLGCSLGTNAFITIGDVDGDGVSDANKFISVANSLTAFAEIPPARKDEISLDLAPMSDLQASEVSGLNWNDDSVSLWYDQINGPVSNQNITKYHLNRIYEAGSVELQRMNLEVVPGSYTFSFPGNPASSADPMNPDPFEISVSHVSMIEPNVGGASSGSNEVFKITNDSDWSQGKLNIDPRLPFNFQWNGLDASNVLPGDTTTFAMYDPGTGQLIYPPYPAATPDNNRVPETIPTPSSSYQLGVGFFSIGESATAELVVTRNHATSTISTDGSSRTFRWDVCFVDSYAGFAEVERASRGLTESQVSHDFDFDGDGFNNLVEYGLQTDPFDREDSPGIRPELDATTGQLQFEVPIRPNVGGELVYQVEFTTDLSNYTTITEDTPGWVIEEDTESLYRVSSSSALATTGCFLRLKIIATP